MKRRLLAAVLCACLLVLCVGNIALADTETGSVVTIGANDNEEQIAKVYDFFRIERGSVPEIVITNQQEREYLQGLVNESKIGNIAVSCAYVQIKDTGGLEIEEYNITYVTEDMYRQALQTAGIANAKVIVAAPRPVSGTGALAGIYVAYEHITGEQLDQDAKDVAVQEMVVTGDLQEVVGDVAPSIIDEIKQKLKETRTMTDDQIRQLILDTAKEHDTELSDEWVQQILDLIKKMNELNIDPDRFLSFTEGSEESPGFFEAIGNFFKSIGDFFANLFGFGKDDQSPETSATPSASALPTESAAPTTDAEPAPTVTAAASSDAETSEGPEAIATPPETPDISATPEASGSVTHEVTASVSPDDFALPTPDPEWVSLTFTGSVTEVQEDNGTYSFTITDNALAQTASAVLTPDTIVLDCQNGQIVDPKNIKTGDRVSATVSANQTRSVPPQSACYALITNVPENSLGTAHFVHVTDKMDSASGDGIVVTNQNHDLEVSIAQDTPIEILGQPDTKATLDDIKVGSNLIVWYDYVLESYPGQTTATRVALAA